MHRAGLVVLLICLVAAFPAPGIAQQERAAPVVERIALPPEFDRVLRDYERAWSARDAAGLAALFTEDGFVMSAGRPPARGRAAIEAHYQGAGGSLFLSAFAHAHEGNIGWIIGGYRGVETDPDTGKFVLALRRGPDGRWLIAADIDNSSRRGPSG